MISDYRWYRSIGMTRREASVLAFFDLPILREF